MKEKNVLWKRFRSMKNIAAILTVAFGLIGVPVSFWLDRPLEGISVMLVFLSVDALMARLDMLSNIEDGVKSTSAAVLDIKTAVENVEMNVIPDDTQIPDLVLKIADRGKVKEVQILSSGLTTRQIMIARLLQKGIRVQVLMQDPLTALDKRDKDRIHTALEWIEHHGKYVRSGLFDARFHINVSTVRAIIVCEESPDVKHIFVSWYYYINKNTKVHGDINPTIYCTTLSKQGAKIYEWLATVIEKDLRESRKITTHTLSKNKN